VPLLAPSGDVDLLVGDAEGEMLVTRDTITSWPTVDPRRHDSPAGFAFGGLAAPGGRALILTEGRPRRRTLSDHGPGPARPLLFLGGDYVLRKRPLSLARRGDGAIGLLVTDGGAFGTAGIAVFDPAAAQFGEVGRGAPWGAVLAGDDPKCGKEANPRAWWSALLVVDPVTWLSLDESELPGMALNHQALMLVRWSEGRVCLDAIDAAVTDREGRRELNQTWNLVVRWAGGKERGAVLRSSDLRQELTCRVVPPRP
jgi:hypothetical protein